MTTSCTELLEVLVRDATHGCFEGVKPGADSAPIQGCRGCWARDELADIGLDHFAACVKALEYEHGAHWKEEPLPEHEDYVINSSCEEAECHVCKLLFALRRALEAALEHADEQ